MRRGPPAALDALWLAEIIRLREEHWGPLDDTDAARHARLDPPDLEARIRLRAARLGARTGLAAQLARWRAGASLSLVLLLLLAVVTGALAAVGALGNGERAVNVLWAIGSLLGLHALSFFIWLCSFFVHSERLAPGLAGAWLWLTRKLARGPDAALVPQAFLNILVRAGALRALFGAVAHLIWFVALSAALITLLAVLSTASYRFIWATTLLDPETFVTLTHTLGYLPAQFGFAMPDAQTVLASDGTRTLPASAQAQWSVWLIGMLVTYGLAPRLIAALASLAMLRRARRRLALDVSLPGYAALRERLLPRVQPTGIDRPADPRYTPRVDRSGLASGDAGERALAVGLELPAEAAWPPPDLPAGVVDGGRLDDRVQRQRLLDALTGRPAARLLIVCDARQTPDRGTIALVAELAAHAAQTRVWLSANGGGPVAAHTPPDRSDRRALWTERLMAAGLGAAALCGDAEQPMRWLKEAA